jgi:hypothetical protein
VATVVAIGGGAGALACVFIGRSATLGAAVGAGVALALLAAWTLRGRSDDFELQRGATILPDDAVGRMRAEAEKGLQARDQAVAAAQANDLAGDRIKHICAVPNPEKLRPWTAG